MIRVSGFPPTRMGLRNARRRLERVAKGADLLRTRREALVAELFRVARPAVDARAEIDARVRQAYPALLDALAVDGGDGVRAAGWPTREIPLEIRTGQLWGVDVVDIAGRPTVRRTLHARGTAPGVVRPATAAAADEFEVLADLLLSAAPREEMLRRLGDALARTSRQYHALQHRLAPALERRITAIQGALDQREREDHLRLRRYVGRRAAPRGPSRSAPPRAG